MKHMLAIMEKHKDNFDIPVYAPYCTALSNAIYVVLCLVAVISATYARVTPRVALPIPIIIFENTKNGKLPTLITCAKNTHPTNMIVVLATSVLEYPFSIDHRPKHGEANTLPKEKAPTAYPSHTEFPPKSCTIGHRIGKVTPRVISPINTTQHIIANPAGSANPSAVIIVEVMDGASKQ